MEWWLWILLIALLTAVLGASLVLTQTRRRRGRVLAVDDEPAGRNG